MELQDKNEMNRLLSLTETNQVDWDSTFNLYKKYVNPNIPGYKVGCGCGNSIENIFRALKDWYLKNHS